MKTADHTRLLVSVRSATEALTALDAGTDVIDVKEPDRGSLGAADAETIRAVLAAIAGRRPVSAALGELAEAPSTAPLPPELSYLKVGLYGAAPLPWRARLTHFFQARRPSQPIAVGYVDHAMLAAPTPAPDDVLEWAIEHGAAGVLLDTYTKANGDLLRFCDIHRLSDFVDRARSAGLLVALAGSLRVESLPDVLACGPDIVAVRGAACAGGNRQHAIDGGRVKAIAAVIAAHAGPPRRSHRPPATCREG